MHCHRIDMYWRCVRVCLFVRDLAFVANVTDMRLKHRLAFVALAQRSNAMPTDAGAVSSKPY